MKLMFSLRSFSRNLSLLFLVGVTFNIHAQEGKRLSASAALGVPVTFFSVKSLPVGIYTGAIRYSFNKNWSLETKLTANTFYNNNTGNPKKATLDDTPTDVASFRTPVYGLNFVGYYNFHKLFGLDKNPSSRWLPYASFGLGLNIYKPEVTYVNGVINTSTKFGKPYRDYQLGLGTRYYINQNIDLFGGAEYHISETYYLDGLKEGVDPQLDQFMNFYAGVSVKFGAKPWDNLIDWSKKNIENPNESPKNYSKWSADATLGLPFLFSPVGGYNLTGMLGLSGRYSFNRAISASLNYNYGHASGDQSGTANAGSGEPALVNEYVTRMNLIAGKVHFNIRNFGVEPAQRTIWNHYVSLGVGYIRAKGDASFANGQSKSDAKLYNGMGIQSIILGYEARKYITHQLDLVAGLDFNYNQSKYLDQAYDKPTLNNHIYLHGGVTYKIKTSKDREHIDWSYGSYNNYKDKSTTVEQVPVIEKPVTQEPKIDTAMTVAPAAPVAPAEPAVVPTPAVAPVAPVEPAPAAQQPQVAVQTPKTAPSTTSPVVVEPAPVRKPEPQVQGEVGPPPSMYNVVVACYSVNKLSVARANQQRLERKGYTPSIYRSSMRSKVLRMSVISTSDRAEAIRTLRKARREIEPQSWIYIYNAQ